MPQMDLSSDSEATVENPLLAPKEVAIDRIITKLFTKFHYDVIITDRLRSLFVSKLYRMGKSFHSLGGSGRSRMLNKWRGTNWSITLTEKEIVPFANKKGKKHTIVINSLKKKCDKLKENLKELNGKLKDVTNKLEKSKKEVSRREISNKRKRKKSWSEYSTKYKQKKLKLLAANVTQALKSTDNDFVYQQVQMCNSETGEVITFKNQDGKPIMKSKEEPYESEDCLVKKNLYIKEKYGEAYHELAMTNPELPSSYKLLKATKQINFESIIRSTPGKATGV